LKRLYLHIGYPKTGTSALQRALVRNTASLAKAGVLYPHVGRINDAHYGFNLSLGVGQYHGNVKIEEAETLRAQLRDEVMRSGCERIIVSSETLSIVRSVERVRDLFSDYDVQVVVYLRRHDHAFESLYSQSAKMVGDPPWQPNIESFILYQLTAKRGQHDYVQVLRRWADKFGKDAISVRPYERSQNTPDLLSDFLKTVQIADSEEFIRPEKVNVSLSPQSVSAIQAIRRSPIPNSIKDLIIETLAGKGNKQRSPKGQYLCPALRNALVRRFSGSYRIIATEFMAGAKGTLFEEEVPQPTDPWTKIPEPSQEELLDLVLRAAATCVRRT
jgi:hypothetical protein